MKQPILLILLFLAYGLLWGQPANDVPCGALPLPLETGTACTPGNSLSWEGATNAQSPGTPACGLSNTLDVWFSFELAAPAFVTIITAEGTGIDAITDGVMEIYSSDGCNGLTPIACDDDSGTGFMPQLTTNELAIGVYYIRFWPYAATPSGTIGGICVVAVDPPPALPNDEPCGALPLTVMAGNDCVPDAPFAWQNATMTASVPAPSCGSQNNNDVWFQFQLDTFANVRIATLKGTGDGAITDAVMEIYGNSDCNNLEHIACDDDSGTDFMPELLVPLEAGTYYIRLWVFLGAASGNIGGICVTATSPSSVVNDLCADAIAFPIIAPDGECATVYGNTLGSSGVLGGAGGGGVFGFPDDDIWYSFTVPVGVNQLAFEFEGISGNVIRNMAIYTACAVVTDPPTAWTAQRNSGIITGLTGGQTYLLRIYTPEANTYSEFNLCLRVHLPTPPTNNNCMGALPFPEIQPDAPCVSVYVDTRYATPTPGQQCNGANYPDVWFSFVVPEGVTNLIGEVQEFVSDGFVESAFSVYSGECGNLTQIFCIPRRASPQLYGLTPGETYYIRAHTEGEEAQYEICLRVAPPIPTNDACLDATPFPIIPTDGTCTIMNINTAGATGPVTNGCSTFSNDGDANIWYTFVVPEGHTSLIFHQLLLGDEQEGIIGYAIYDGDCDGLERVACGGRSIRGLSSGELVSNLVGGKTYYLEAFSGVSYWTEHGVNLCIRTAPPTPAHDTCQGALEFPEIPADGTWASLDLSTLSATGAVNNALCGGAEGNDVWTRFTVPEGYDQVRYRVSNLRNQYMTLALYADDCDDIQLITCLDYDRLMHIPGLEGGRSYLIRAFDAIDAPDEVNGPWAEFTLSMALPIGIPSNDECPQAIVIPAIPSDGSCAYVIGETFQATGTPTTTCEGVENDDVWYVFQMPEDATALNFENINTYGYAYPYIQLFEGDCGTLVHVECLDGVFYPHFIQNLTPGTTYYLRVYSAGSATSGSFQLCLSTSPAPANDNCEGAISITGQPGMFVDPGILSNQGATSSPQGGCDLYFIDPYDTWYSFETGAEGGDVEITVTSMSLPGGFIEDMIVQVLEGTCDGFASLGCLSGANQLGAYGATTVNLYGLAPLTTYLFRVYQFSASGATQVPYTIHAQGSALSYVVGTEEVAAPADDAFRIEKVFPVPTDDQLVVHYTSSSNSPVQYQLFSATGILVQQGSGSSASYPSNLRFSLADLPPGIYFLTIQQDGRRALTQKVVKQ